MFGNLGTFVENHWFVLFNVSDRMVATLMKIINVIQRFKTRRAFTKRNWGLELLGCGSRLPTVKSRFTSVRAQRPSGNEALKQFSSLHHC